jgi:hypothetical protein
MSLDHSAKAPALPSEISAGVLMNPTRLVMIARCWIAVAFATYVIDLLRQTRLGLTDGVDRPFGDDFINYWSGAFLALHGRAAEVYDFLAFHAFESSVTGPHIDLYHYSYPPVLLLLTAPLALVPYVPALGLWLVGTWYAFYRALKLTGSEGVLLLSLATPALFVNAFGGQNGALTAALMGGGLVLVDRRPIVAGILFGLLAYKPHLALMLPVALIAGRRWSTVGAAGMTVLLLVIASVLAFGPGVWLQYEHNVSVLRAIILEEGVGVGHRMVSVFVFARQLGASVSFAYGLQSAFALPAVFFVARSWLRDDPAYIRNAMVVVGTGLLTPYLQDYDLVIGAFVVVWLWMGEANSRIPAHWIRVAMAMILLLPIAAAPLAKYAGFPPGPLIFVMVFALLIVLAADHRREPACQLAPGS